MFLAVVSLLLQSMNMVYGMYGTCTAESQHLIFKKIFMLKKKTMCFNKKLRSYVSLKKVDIKLNFSIQAKRTMGGPWKFETL
jgi:hypothetical protein